MKNIPYEYRRELSKKFKYPIQAGTDVNLKNEREALNAITHVKRNSIRTLRIHTRKR